MKPWFKRAVAGALMVAVSLASSGETIVHGGSFAENVEKAFGTALIMAGTAYGADFIGNHSEALGDIGTELAHAGLGCVGGALSSGSSDGCAAGASGALAAHAFTQWYDPANGKTLDDLSQSEKYLIVQVGGIIGGAVASIVGGGSSDALANFELGQQTGANAVENNYLMHLEAQRRAQLQQQCKETGGCTAVLLDELAALDALDKQRDADLRSACSSSYGGSSGSAACKTELGNLQAARLSYGVLFQGMTGQDWINESANVGKIVQFLNGYGQNPNESTASMPARDKLTNLPLDDQGRYSATVAVGGELHRPKFFSCATTDCMKSGANLDMSDPATQAYVKAIDRQIFKDIGTGATLGTLITPVGAPATVLTIIGAGATAGEVAMSTDPVRTGVDKGIEAGSEKVAQVFFEQVLGHPPAVAARAAILINLTGGWESFRERVKADLLGIVPNDNGK